MFIQITPTEEMENQERLFKQRKADFKNFIESLHKGGEISTYELERITKMLELDFIERVEWMGQKFKIVGIQEIYPKS